jgi:hypothetical protein
MAIGIAGFVVSVFVIVMAGTVLNKRYEAAEFRTEHHATVAHAVR